MSKGRDLAQEIGIHCKQALYSSWGNSYAAISSYQSPSITASMDAVISLLLAALSPQS